MREAEPEFRDVGVFGPPDPLTLLSAQQGRLQMISFENQPFKTERARAVKRLPRVSATAVIKQQSLGGLRAGRGERF